MPRTKVYAFVTKSSVGNALHTIDGGSHSAVDGGYFNVNSFAKILEMRRSSDDAVVVSATQYEVAERLSQISDMSYAKSSYDRVKQNIIWKLMYQNADRHISYIYGTAPFPKPKSSYPCTYCGIVLPEKLITIDHQRPQKGGTTEAVAKVFRILGLTREKPRGAKGAFLYQKNLSTLQLKASNGSLGHVPAIPTRKGVPAKADTVNGLDDRYTLNRLGIFLYSIVVASKALEELESLCMHSLINLAPSCQSCNSTRSNRTLKF